MLKYIVYTLFAGVLLVSCASNEDQQKKVAMPPEPASPVTEAKPDFKGVAFASTKDLVCGMPIKAGIADTAHYKGKIYGFCATECKAEFLKDPNQYLAVKK